MPKTRCTAHIARSAKEVRLWSFHSTILFTACQTSRISSCTWRHPRSKSQIVAGTRYREVSCRLHKTVLDAGAAHGDGEHTAMSCIGPGEFYLQQVLVSKGEARLPKPPQGAGSMGTVLGVVETLKYACL